MSAEPVPAERERGNGHADVRTPAAGSQWESVEWVDTAAAADLLDITSRQVRRLVEELGGQQVKGAWRFSTAAVHAEAQRRREQQ
jgi:plasmid replication initiation protein